MDFSIPASLEPTLSAVRRFVDDRLIRRELEWLAAPSFAAIEPSLGELREEVKRLGLWLPQAPKELGGLGLSVLEHGLVSEALGRTPFGHYVFGCQAPDAGNLEILHAHGTAEQKERWLEPLAAGRIRSCFSMTEPDRPGSNPTELACRAVKDGDDWVIDGKKWFTTGADGAAVAIVMAVTHPDAHPYARASQILVPTDTPGFRIVRNIPVMGHAGSGWASHSEIAYEGCRVPRTNTLGAEGSGFRIAQERLGPGRIHHSMRWLGISGRAFELMCDRAASRRIDGEKTLAEEPIVQQWIAEARAEIDAARLLVLEAAWRIDRHGFSAARVEISLIKFYVAGVMSRVVDRAVQVHGALGLTGDTVLSWWYAHERAAHIYDGPDEVHKLAAARRILRDRAQAERPTGGAQRAEGERSSRGGGQGVSHEDRTAPVRAGEELDGEKLRAFLSRVLGEPVERPVVEQFPGGHSNLTYLIRLGERDLVLRRPPFGSRVKGAHDMGREHRILSRLSLLKAWAPRPVAFCDDPDVIGSDFYLMERVRGVVLRRSLPSGVSLDPSAARRLCETLIDTLVELHAIDWLAAGLAEIGKPEGYVERQVHGWSRRYLDAKTEDLESMSRITGWLERTMTTLPPSGAAVIHNDYKFDNVVYDSVEFRRIVGVLDWEMATIGDPLMDLGTALCYWVEAGDSDGLKSLSFAPTMAPGMLTRAELARLYADRSGRAVDDLLFHYVFGLFKTAIVLQQIYYRYAQGLTHDPRFATLHMGARLLAEQAERAIRDGSV